MEELTGRAVRRFALYHEGLHAATVSSEPGRLISTAGPPPGGPPSHPWVHLVSYQAIYESELAGLLGQATGFDDYLQLLLQAGYDIGSDDLRALKSPGAGVRLLEGNGPVAAAWAGGGQCTCLWLQPEKGQEVYPQARLTIYARGWASRLHSELRAAPDYETFCRAVAQSGLRLLQLAVRGW
ncbi:MAG: hypothetical protein GXX94_04360 [Chloroflexi bacterium]|nr:hypothetical protein [Chloroflexota bacterium]